MSASIRLVAAGLGTLALVGVPAVGTAATVTSAPIKIGANKHLFVEWRGNGHGHGMSQWGAYGQAVAKRSYQTILKFYYPGTALGTQSSTARIRVLIGAAGRTNAVHADLHLVVGGVSGTLPTTGIRRYRLIAGSTSGLVLQKLPSAAGATWKTVKTLPHNNTAAFHRTDFSPVRVFLSDGTSTSYYGYLRAVRTSATTVQTVDDVSYEGYVAGVVPRESPASWPAAATDAQAVAARSYAEYVAATAPRKPGVYDVYDDTRDQMYGGHVHYNANGSPAYTDFAKAAKDTKGKVLRYNGAPVFAQFSASNGGWTVAYPTAGFPYLVAKQDPYDPVPAANPNIVVTQRADTKISVADLAKQFKLTTITEIDLVRDGHANAADPTMWGGRIVSGTLTDGTHVKSFTGDDFQRAVNNVEANYFIGTPWIQLVPTA
jgi:peptidoglycan hydrolase-like amidase